MEVGYDAESEWALLAFLYPSWITSAALVMYLITSHHEPSQLVDPTVGNAFN